MKKLFTIFLYSFIAFCAFGQNNKTLENSLLWQITKKGTTQKSYLFGTIHVICAEDYFWTQKMQDAFNKSEQLCLEMDLSQKDIDMETAAQLMDFSGTVLKDYFSNAADYELVKNYIEDSLKQDIQVVERLKPVALYMMYSFGLIQAPCKQNTESYELNLVNKAQAGDKKIIGLETISQQLQALESLPTDSIIAQMIQIAKGKKEDHSSSTKLIAAYKQQDLASLNDLILENEKEVGMNSKILLDQRNQNWIPKLAQLMQEKSTFIAVGAGHLKGLIALLRQQGYTVKAL